MIVAITSVANADNGSYSGYVRLFEWQNGVWTQLGNAIEGKAADDRSGTFVDISSDGMIVAVGSAGNSDNGNRAGQLRIFEWINEDWKQLGDDIYGDEPLDGFGQFGALSSDGSVVAAGAILNDGLGGNNGHVKVYNLDVSRCEVGTMLYLCIY
jgi:hypothetical protein